jgi:hypothetical protein
MIGKIKADLIIKTFSKFLMQNALLFIKEEPLAAIPIISSLTHFFYEPNLFFNKKYANANEACDILFMNGLSYFCSDEFDVPEVKNACKRLHNSIPYITHDFEKFLGEHT